MEIGDVFIWEATKGLAAAKANNQRTPLLNLGVS
jgi:hypothetical protein